MYDKIPIPELELSLIKLLLFMRASKVHYLISFAFSTILFLRNICFDGQSYGQKGININHLY